MKKVVLFSILVLSLGFTSYSQQISQNVLSSGGGEFTSVLGENVSFTIGQAFYTETLNDNKGNFLTQGFEQPTNSNNAALLSPAFPDLELTKMDVYPNPAVDYTDLELNMIDNNGAKVALIDMWGQAVKTQNFNIEKGQQKLHFTFGSLAPGVYTVKVNANQRVYAKKLIVNTVGYSSTF
jgi:hypothetical protein